MHQKTEKPENDKDYKYGPQHWFYFRSVFQCSHANEAQLLIRTLGQHRARLKQRAYMRCETSATDIYKQLNYSLATNTDKMRNAPFWIDSAPIRRFPRLQRNINVDVVIIGAGVTGVTTAYLMKKEGFTVALIERERVASIDTGHTTAHLTYITDVQLHELAHNFGSDHAQAAWDAGAAAIDEIERIVHDEEIDCEFTRVPAYVHVCVDGFSKKEISSLKKEARLAAKLGFDAAYLDSIPYFGLPGVRFPNQAKFHPRKYLRSLVAKIPGNGSHVFEKSAAKEFDRKKRRLKINRYWIGFDRVVIATNNPLVGLASITSATLLQTKLSLYTSYALGARVPPETVPEALFWDTREPYDYLRVDRCRGFDYVVYGGEDHKTGQKRKTQRAYARLLARLKKITPEARLDHRWSGQIISTPDGLPYIGENTENQFVGTGYCGNGITFGTISAMMARDWAAGQKNPWTQLFAVDRKKLKGTAWNYIRENKDYPYYMIKDRIARPEADSARELKRGEGMVVGSRGRKVAAFRDHKGELHRLSPVCPHLGCHVRWNPAESTWDCPCHGSRFKATGEVISGPAEEALRRA
jgi:glycine/D-amino acid oxidase-like deaminating enzyme/nitrite reductase/ring-hydroxylating ferredoxin subunit